MTLTQLRQDIASDRVEFDPLDDPDCLAEMEFTYSVFRFRHSWGTVYELTFTNLSDGYDRTACWGLLPGDHRVVDTRDTDTMGVGYNGVSTEVTHRVVVSDDWS